MAAVTKFPVLLALVGLSLLPALAGAAQPAVGLGAAGTYAVLAASGVSNTGPSTLNGDLGVSPGASITGFPPGTVNGATHAADAASAQAQADATTAYNDAEGRTPFSTVTGDLGGSELVPGVYRSGSSIGLTGTVTLNGQGDRGAVFIFQMGSSLTTASGSTVALINGAQACNVFWQVGSSATFGTGTSFAGTVIADISITLNDSVTLSGRALARTGAVTLINDTISAPGCAATTTDAPAAAPAPAPVPAAQAPPAPAAPAPAAAPQVAPTAVTPPSFRRTRCVNRSFRASVLGSSIRRVVFTSGGQVVGNQTASPFSVVLGRLPGSRVVTARVTFVDGTPPKSLRMRFKACASARRPVQASPTRNPGIPPGFTG